jgi:hypothetical protein
MVIGEGWEPIGAIRDLEGMVFGWCQREWICHEPLVQFRAGMEGEEELPASDAACVGPHAAFSVENPVRG